MDKYRVMEVVGEGSYGVVVKCEDRETGRLVAIKRFLETEEDHRVRKMAFREIRMLKKLRHENLVNMLEVFRRRRRFYLVFEYLDHTLLDELERAPGHGLGWEPSRRHVYQLLRGLAFCHASNIIHRDVKPENVLVSPSGVVKLCDFGFARPAAAPNESCTDYVATRWYRAPELLLGQPRYGKPVDVWAVGCVYAEMLLGDPLFPGDSDVDQLYRIGKVLGGLCPKHRAAVARGRPARLLRDGSADELAAPPRSALRAIRLLFPAWPALPVDFLARCLRMDPDSRPACELLLRHPFFTRDRFAETFLLELASLRDAEVAPTPPTSFRLLRDEDRPSWRIPLSPDEHHAAADDDDDECSPSSTSPVSTDSDRILPFPPLSVHPGNAPRPPLRSFLNRSTLLADRR